MGLFGNFFKKIGSGLTSIVKPLGKAATWIHHKVLAPVYTSVIKPTYKSVVRPIAAGVGRILGKTASTAEHTVEGALDFSERFQKQGQDNALGLAKGFGNLTELLSNPLVMVGMGVAGLIVVSKI